MNLLFLFFFTFLFIFGWKVTSLIDLIALTSLVLAALVFGLLRVSIPRQSLTLGFLISLSLVYSCVAAIIGGAADIQIVLRSIRALVNFIGGAALASIFLARFGVERVLQATINCVFFVLVCHAGLILAMYVSESLRQAVYSMADTYSYVNLYAPFLSGLRIPGLTYGLAQTSVLQMFGLVLAPVVFTSVVGRKWLLSLFWVSIVLLIISMFLTGRSGLLLASILLPIQFLVRKLLQDSSGVVKSKKWVLATASILILFFSFAVFFLKDNPVVEKAQYNIQVASEVLEALQTGGKTSTIDTIRTMYFVPDNPFILLFGSGGLGRGELGNVASDVGFIRLIHAVGLVGMTLMLLPIVFAFSALLRGNAQNLDLRLAIGVMLTASLLLNFKELSLMTRNQWSVEVLLLSVLFLVSKAESKSGEPLPAGTQKTKPSASSPCDLLT